MASRSVVFFAGASFSFGTMLLMGQPARGSAILLSASGPTATFTGSTSNAVNFTIDGSYAWAFYASTASGGVASPPYEKSSDPTAISALVGLTPTGTSTVGSGRYGGGTPAGVTASVTTTDGASTNLAGAGYTYITTSGSATGYGMESSYTMPANSKQTLSIYCYTLSGVFGEMKLTENDGGVITPLYDDGSSGVLLPVSIAQSNKDGGVYRFQLENDDSVSHLINFAYTVAGYPSGTTGGQIGFEGATVATVPEPASATIAVLAGVGLLLRRRRFSQHA